MIKEKQRKGFFFHCLYLFISLSAFCWLVGIQSSKAMQICHLHSVELKSSEKEDWGQSLLFLFSPHDFQEKLDSNLFCLVPVHDAYLPTQDQFVVSSL